MSLIDCLQRYGAIPSGDVELITSCFAMQTYREGDVLFRGGSVCREMFFIYDGVVRMSAVGEAGNEVTFFFVREGVFCTVLDSFLHETVTDHSIVAAGDVRVGMISKVRLELLYQALPYLEMLITRISQELLIHKINLRNSYLSLPDASSRYKLFLEQQSDVALRVPLHSIASYLGITPQSLSRIRRQIR